MTFDKNSWHYKLWAGSFPTYVIKPSSTDLCRYCHRVFWAAALRVILLCMACTMLGLLGYAGFYKGLYCKPVPTLAVIGVIGGWVGGIWLYINWLDRGRIYREPKTLVGKWARARKQQVCPVVEFTSSNSDNEDD